MCICEWVASLVNNGMKIPLLTLRWPQAEVYGPLSVLDDCVFPLASFRLQTKGRHFCDWLRATAAYPCMNFVVCVSEYGASTKQWFRRPTFSAHSFGAPFACFQYHIFPFPILMPNVYKIRNEKGPLLEITSALSERLTALCKKGTIQLTGCSWELRLWKIRKLRFYSLSKICKFNKFLNLLTACEIFFSSFTHSSW